MVPSLVDVLAVACLVCTSTVAAVRTGAQISSQRPQAEHNLQDLLAWSLLNFWRAELPSRPLMYQDASSRAGDEVFETTQPHGVFYVFADKVMGLFQ